jgi:hypothetical protein
MYRCPPEYTDSLPIDFRSVGLDISDCLRLLSYRGYLYDAILVDPFHEYAPSMRDLSAACSLLTSRGTIVVHDCLPPTTELAVPDFIPGNWCGVTYKAYLDFLFARSNLEFCTVNIDYGCGVIRKRSGLARLCGWSRFSRQQRALIAEWQTLGNNFDQTFNFFQKNKTLLCNLRSLEDFITDERKDRHSRAQT